MKLKLNLFFILVFSLTRKLRLGQRIVFNGKSYSHLWRGIFFRVFVSARFQKIYEVSFLNNENQQIKLIVNNELQVQRYKKMKLNNFSVISKTIRKK